MKKTKQYYVIQFEDYAAETPYAPSGPFESIAAAEKWLIEEAENILETSTDIMSKQDCESWSSPSLIVEVVRSYKQVPSYQLEVKLKRL